MSNNTTQYDPTSTEISGVGRITQASAMMKDKLSAFYSRGVPLVNVWIALSFLVKMRLHKVSFTSPSIIMYLACLVVSFSTDMVMNLKFVTELSRWRWMIAYLSTILQISTAAALMLFFNTIDTMIVIALFCLVLALFSYLFRRMLVRGRDPWLTWLRFKEQLNRKFEMSALVVAPSVAGLSGKVLGYVEGSSSNNLTAGGQTVVAPELLLFFSSVSSLLVVLFCTVPLPLSTDRWIEPMANVYIPSIAFTALSFFVGATVVAAQKILQEYVYLVGCLITIIAGLLYLSDAQRAGSSPCLPQTAGDTAEQRPVDEVRQEEAKLSKTLSTAGISPILLAIMAIHSSYGGGSTVSLSWPWKAFVSLAMCSILSHTVLILILDQMTERRRYEISRKFWTAGTFAAITGTAVFAVLVICLHPDEAKNIF